MQLASVILTAIERAFADPLEQLDAEVRSRGLSLAETISQRGLQLLGIKSERPGFALVSERAISSHDEQPVRPGHILLLDAIIDPINQCRDLYVELTNARGCHILPLSRGSRIPEDHALFDIALHLPDIAWVSLDDVNQVERRLLVVPLV